MTDLRLTDIAVETLNIYQRMNKVMQSVKYIKRDADVYAGGSSYKAVTHDALVAEIRQSMVDNGIVVQVDQLKGKFLIQRDIEKGVKMHLYSGWYRISLVNIDNPEEYYSGTINAHASDNGDKSPGKCVTFAVKSFLVKAFTLETGVNDESRAFEEKTLKEWCDELQDSILAIKEGIASNDYSSASEAWAELSDDEKRAIWVAPTMIVHGKRVPRPDAPFTTDERNVIKSTEFKEAYYGTQ